MHKVKQKASYYKPIVGYNFIQQKVIPLPLLCMRKPTNKSARFPFFIFTSNPKFVRHPEYTPFMLLHCHRDSSVIPIECPKYLISESDFMDKMFIKVNHHEPKYDYFYYTLNDSVRGIDYKGFDNFMQCLHVFKDMNLRGVIIVYFNGDSHRWNYPLGKSQFKLLDKANLKIIWKAQKHDEVASTMSKCKFGFFPNKNDCSPRMVAECLIRNRPVLMNKNIVGGWKYIDQNSEFGSFFDPNDINSIVSGVKSVMELPRNQGVLWEKDYGFEKQSRNLAELIKKHQKFNGMEEISHIYFEEYSEALEIVGASV